MVISPFCWFNGEWVGLTLATGILDLMQHMKTSEHRLASYKDITIDNYDHSKLVPVLDELYLIIPSK